MSRTETLTIATIIFIVAVAAAILPVYLAVA